MGPCDSALLRLPGFNPAHLLPDGRGIRSYRLWYFYGGATWWLVGDQQGALVGNKWLAQSEAKCIYGTNALLLFCMGTDIMYNTQCHPWTAQLIASPRIWGIELVLTPLFTGQYHACAQCKPVYDLEGASKNNYCSLCRKALTPSLLRSRRVRKRHQVAE